MSSFNSFLTEYDTDSESNSESEYESGIEDSDHNSTAPPSPSSESSHLSRGGSSGRRHRRHKTLLQRLLLWMLWPLRLWSRLWYVRPFALILSWIEDAGFRSLQQNASAVCQLCLGYLTSISSQLRPSILVLRIREFFMVSN